MLSFGRKRPNIAYLYDASTPLVLIQQTNPFAPFSVVNKHDPLGKEGPQMADVAEASRADKLVNIQIKSTSEVRSSSLQSLPGGFWPFSSDKC